MKDKKAPTVPDTGDETNLNLWLGLLGIAAIGLLGGIYFKRKEVDIDE